MAACSLSFGRYEGKEFTYLYEKKIYESAVHSQTQQLITMAATITSSTSYGPTSHLFANQGSKITFESYLTWSYSS
jgi:hypothetical protein